MRLSPDDNPLLCGVCGAPLSDSGRSLRCPTGHTFDVAREGYVNLLLPHQTRREVVGDDRAMLRARRRFLDRGFYRPLSEAINERVAEHIEGRTLAQAHIVDVGSGEGSYLAALKAHLEARFETAFTFTGVDIAKEAARLAARRYDGIRFVVADITVSLLLPEASVDVLLNVFAPRSPGEFYRVLRPGGLLLVVIPAPGHLASLREQFGLLGIEQDKREHVAAQFAEDFALADTRRIEYALALGRDDLLDLVEMTPNYWHLTPETRDALHASPGVETQAAFDLLAFRRS